MSKNQKKAGETKPEVQAAEVKTDKTNVKAAEVKKTEQQIQYMRDLKWKYPADCTTAKDRKVFRALNRGKIRRLEARAMKTDDAKAQAKLMREARAIRKEALMDVDQVL